MNLCRTCANPLTEQEIKDQLFVNVFNFFKGHKVITPICQACYDQFAGIVGTNQHIGVENVKKLFGEYR